MISEELLLGFHAGHASLRSGHASLFGGLGGFHAGHASRSSRGGHASHASLFGGLGGFHAGHASRSSRCRSSSRGRGSSLRLFLLTTGGQGDGNESSNENRLIHGNFLIDKKKKLGKNDGLKTVQRRLYQYHEFMHDMLHRNNRVSSETECRGPVGRTAFGPDFLEAPAVGRNFIGFVDQQFAAPLVAVETDQRMDIVDQNDRVA
jgi:hypothetical protein